MSAGAELAERREKLLADRSLTGVAFTRAYATSVDEWLTDLLGGEENVALVAVGGYGRGELAPGSDLDLILLHTGRRDVAELASRLWYPVWDAGLKLDHSVKTVKEALAVGDGDLKAAMGLLDARLVAGRSDLVDELSTKARAQWQRRSSRWLPELDAATRERHARVGDVAFRLEPDVKEGRGGLRDVTALRAAAIAAPVIPPESETVRDAADVLAAVRVELHRATGRASDLFILQEQEEVAASLGYDNADALMHALSAAGRRIAWASDDAWRRTRNWQAGPRGRVAGFDREASPGVVLRDGEVVVTADADMTEQSLALRVVEASAQYGASIAWRTLERLRDEWPGIGEERWKPRTREALVASLAAGVDAIAAFEAIDHFDVLVRVLPEWAPVRSRPQHNPYHRFTVDRHLIEAAVAAAPLAERVVRPDLLLVATLLHDLGKGYPGDHTEVGVALAKTIGHRMGFTLDDVDVICRLIGLHLLLPDTATKRDVRDPATIERVAAEVRDPFALELLAALVEADAKATGDTAWTPWKAGLVRELTSNVASALAGRAPTPVVRQLDPDLEALVAAAPDGLVVHIDNDVVTVVAPDRAGLFAQLAGVLSLHGLDILAADAWAGPSGSIIDVFHVAYRRGAEPAWDRVRRDIERCLEGGFALDARLAERASAYDTYRRPQSRHPVTPSVTIDNIASAESSVIEVRAEDAVGVLYRIARALFDLRLDIQYAKVLTLGHEVVDSFYVVDQRGRKIDDDERVAEIERALTFALSATR